MNTIIYMYEFGLVPFSEFTEKVADSGQMTIEEVGEDCFAFYVRLAANYHNNRYYIKPYELYSSFYEREKQERVDNGNYERDR